MSTLLALRQALGTAVEKLEIVINDKSAKKSEIEAAEKEVDELENRVKAAQRNQERIARGAKPSGASGAGGQDGPADPTRFKNLGEQLIAIMRHYTHGITDPRLRAPSGMGETDPSGGGFPIQADFAQAIMMRIYDMGEIAQRVFRVPISTNANGIKIPGIDETSRVTGSRWGGVQAYWVGEGDAITASKPKFRLIELDLKKLACLWYVTDELMQDGSALMAIANEAFAEELTFVLEDAIIRGTGAGMPQGILNASSLVTVPIEKGQATQTILYQNLLKMWSHMWIRSRSQAVWFINQDVEPQLNAVNQTIGTAGAPAYMPPGGLSEKPFASLFGRPVIPVEYCATLGTPSDILLADFSQYVIADKNAMQQASSIHVRFVNDETTFRITYRLDGQPMWQAPLTPYQGTNLKSPFVVLAQR